MRGLNHEDTKSTKKGKGTRRGMQFFLLTFVLFVSSWFNAFGSMNQEAVRAW